MKRIIFVLMAALAFVACQKEEPKKERIVPVLYPNAISCLDNAGMILEIKSDIPSMFYAALLMKEGEKEGDDHFIYETSNDRYHITQIDEYTYQLTIKPFVEERRLILYFAVPNRPVERIGFAVIGCGYELDDVTIEYLDRFHKWAKEDEQ